MSEQRAIPTRRRRREALSCEPCRRMKIKCDQKSPCNQCSVRSRIETCVYSRPKSTAVPENRPVASALTPTSLTSTPSALSTIVETPHHPQPNESDQSHVKKGLAAHDPIPPVQDDEEATTRQIESSVSRSDSRIDGIWERMVQMEKKLSAINQSQAKQASSTSSESHGSRIPVKGIFNKSRLFGQSHWMSCIYELDAIVGLSKLLTQFGPNGELNRALTNCKNLARQAKALVSMSQPIHPDIRTYVPSREIADKLIEAHFRTFESIWRVLHIPSFRREYADYWTNPQTSSNMFIIQLLLVMAIGGCFEGTASDPIALRASALQWIFAARVYLDLIPEKSRLTIKGLQIHCLLLLARLANGFDADLVWISAGGLFRTALQMGLHRDPSRLPNMSPYMTEIRRRLWATILELQVQSGMDSGAPLLMSTRSFDCKPPSNLDDAQLDENSSEPPEEKPADVFTQSSLQIMLLSSFKTRLKVADVLNDVCEEKSYDDTLRISAELSTFQRTFSRVLEKIPEDATFPSSFHRKLFGHYISRFLLALHHPWALIANSNPAYYYSRKVSLDTAMFMLTQTSMEIFEGSEWQKEDYTRLQVYGGGFLKGCLIHAAVVLSLEIFTRFKEDTDSFRADSQRQSRMEVWKVLQRYTNLLACRVKAGETNVQGVAAIRGVAAQIEALEAGIDPEPAMIKAMTEMMEWAQGVLKERVEAGTAAQVATVAENRPMFESYGEVRQQQQQQQQPGAAGPSEGYEWMFADWTQLDGMAWE